MDESDCVVITGGTGKLGRILVEGLAQHGYTVCFTSRVTRPLRETFPGIASSVSRNRVLGMALDLTAPDAADKLTDFLEAEGLTPTCLVNNARDTNYLRVDGNGMPSLEGWSGEFRLDVVVPYQLSMTLATQDGGRLRSIVNIASMYGVVAANPSLYEDPQRDSPIHYGVIKAALIHLTKELAVRLASRGVRANSISYGGVEGRVNDAFKARYGELCPSGCMLNDEDILGPVEFLASAASSGVTGHNLVVDGGWTTW